MKAEFVASLPRFPYCADDPTNGVYRKPKREALQCLLIQPNHDKFIRWLPFDYDQDGGYFRPQEVGLPEPSFYAFNRANAHSHILYQLEEPVSKSLNSHSAPMQFLMDVQRGMCRRLGADKAYSGTLCKNVTHSHWEVVSTGASPLSLARLNDYLTPQDKAPWTTVELEGLGRNCDLFNEVRKIAYRTVERFKKDNKTENDFRRFLDSMAFQINMSFDPPLFLTEVGSVTKSVAKWTWWKLVPNKTSARFSAIQRERAMKRWRAYTPRIRKA